MNPLSETFDDFVDDLLSSDLNLPKSNHLYSNHAYIRKLKAQLLLLSKYTDLNYVIKNTFLR